jgi:peptide/nickel transport system permease protein
VLSNEHFAKRFGATAFRSAFVLLISGLAGGALVRLSPGFGVDEHALDARLSAQTIEARNKELAGDGNVAGFYLRFLSGLLHGDAGRSTSFGRPVSEIIRERLPATVRTVSAGLVLGWTTAVLMAAIATLARVRTATLVGTAVSSSFLCIPSALLAIVCVMLELPPATAIAAVVLPRIYGYAYAELHSAVTEPHVVMARARGVPAGRVFVRHVVPPVLMPLLALAGVSVTLAFSASIPVETLTDSPGIGQLAWEAAMSRDLPVLVAITLLLTVVTVGANLGADLLSHKLRSDSL